MNRACINQKCADPCPGTCGLNTRCEVINHSPICSCQNGYTGDPFASCYPVPRKNNHLYFRNPHFSSFIILAPPPAPVQIVSVNPCVPSPCGPFSQCRDIGGTPSCSCLPNYQGNPPNCRPECVINPECPSNLACIREKCSDPCVGSCGANALCSVINHIPICTCPDDLTGDPFSNCFPKPPPRTKRHVLMHFLDLIWFILAQIPVVSDLCNPSPCGPNTECRNGICTCLLEYQGDPYIGCRPECILNNDCSRDKACLRNKCVDPCPGTCGQNADCRVINHIPTCTCIDGFIGNAFVLCSPVPGIIYKLLFFSLLNCFNCSSRGN